MPGQYPKFKNDLGVTEIAIGVTEFKCVGASPPHDHPHIYHKLNEQGFVHCLYCNTKFVYRPHLGRLEIRSTGQLLRGRAP